MNSKEIRQLLSNAQLESLDEAKSLIIALLEDGEEIREKSISNLLNANRPTRFPTGIIRHALGELMDEQKIIHVHYKSYKAFRKFFE